LLKAFELNYIVPILQETTKNSAGLLPYPYPIGNEFYEILLSAIYFDSAGQPILQEQKQIHLFEYLDAGLKMSPHIHQIRYCVDISFCLFFSLFRVTFKLYQDFPSQECLQRLWSIIQSEVVQWNHSIDLPESEKYYQLVVFKEFDSWITDPSNFSTAPSLEDMFKLTAIHYHINRWIQSHHDDPGIDPWLSC
jgi:hypothetical protein